MADVRIKRFGTAFNVENRQRLCAVRILDGLYIRETEPMALRDALSATQFYLGEFSEDAVELSACMADLRRSGYGTVAGINVRIIPHYGV